MQACEVRAYGLGRQWPFEYVDVSLIVQLCSFRVTFLPLPLRTR